MKWILFLLCPFIAICQQTTTTIAADSCGLVVTLREKYGPTTTDTATVVSMLDGYLVLTHRATQSAWFSTQNFALKTIERLK